MLSWYLVYREVGFTYSSEDSNLEGAGCPLGLYVPFQIMDALSCIVQTSGNVQALLRIFSAALECLFPAVVVFNL